MQEFVHVCQNTCLMKWRNHDALELFRLVDRNRSHLRRWLSWLDTYESPAAAEHFITESARMWASGESFRFGVWHQGTLVGAIALEQVKKIGQSAMIGYWLGQEAERRGLMTQSVQALCDLGSAMGLDALQIAVAPQNCRSQAIAKRLNFVKEKTLRREVWLYDHYEDQIVYSLPLRPNLSALK